MNELKYSICVYSVKHYIISWEYGLKDPTTSTKAYYAQAIKNITLQWLIRYTKQKKEIEDNKMLHGQQKINNHEIIQS